MAERAQLRQIPSVEKILSSNEFGPLIDRFGRGGVKHHLTCHLAELRRSSSFSGFSLSESARAVETSLRAAFAPKLRAVINGTGILIHTNLGRSPLDEQVWASGGVVANSYSNLEFDLEEGERGTRDQHVSDIATQLFGCEAAILVNNNAGAVLLLLASLAAGKEVLVSRGELVEIGGSFRIPEVIQQGGAKLREVGTTNRTRARDYADAITRKTAAILKVHQSNFQVIGFTESAPIEDLVTIGVKKKIPVVMDEGSGRVVDLATYGFAAQPTLAELLGSGLDAVTCSTDKLIGSLQGGLILGKRSVVERCARHPLMRALRAGKESYGTLAATLRSYLAGKYEQEVPIYRMLATPMAELRRRGEALARSVGGEVIETRSALGGGTTPTESIPSIAIALRGPLDDLARSLRAWNPPIVPRIEDDQLVLDLRTVFPREDAVIVEALRAAAASRPPARSA
jgi:L-seryl-tRNA(Ser) seleniumtransferase